MPYDPETDPRYLPDIAHRVLQHVQAEVEERQERISDIIRQFEQIEALYDTEGWAHLVAIVAAEADQLDNRLITDTDIHTWRYHRGQRAFADFILTLPQTTGGKLAELRQAQAKLQARNEDLQDELGG